MYNQDVCNSGETLVAENTTISQPLDFCPLPSTSALTNN